MDRRGFLTTTFAGGLAATGSACANGPRGELSAPLAEDELDRKLARLDRTLERMNHQRATRWYLKHHEDAEAPDLEQIAHDGELVRASLRSALVLSTIAELPEANRIDPRVVARIQEISGEADYAVAGTLAKLRSLDAEELAALDQEFAQASPAMDVAGRIDELSAEIDVSASRRLHLRRMAKHLDWRLERERFSDVVRDVVGTVERAVETATRQLREAGPELAVAGADPHWRARMREIVAFYAPAPEAAPETTPEAPMEAPVMNEPPPPAEPAQPAQPQPATYQDAGTVHQESPPPYQEAPPPGGTPYSQEEVAAAQRAYAAVERQKELAKAERDHPRGLAMLGAGAGLLVIGGTAVGVGLYFSTVAGIVAAGIGGVGITVGLILLIIGIVLAVRAKKVKRKYGVG